jgi:hypothetical protein
VPPRGMLSLLPPRRRAAGRRQSVKRIGTEFELSSYDSHCAMTGRVLKLGAAGAPLAITLAFTAPVHATAAQTAKLSASLNTDGSGILVANSQSNPPGETWSWEVCRANLTGCAAFANGRTVETDGAAAGSAFFAMSSEGAIALSPVWHGNVVALTPPSVSGAVRANEAVTPVAGTWSGGWDGDYSRLQLASCTDPQGTVCKVLTEGSQSGCPGGAAVLEPELIGEYLRVADQLVGPDTVFALAAAGFPPSAWRAAPTVSLAMVGKIGPAVGPRSIACGPPPAGAVVTSAVVSGATVRVKVICPGARACTLTLTLSVIEVVRDGRAIAVVAAKRAPRLTTRTVMLASKTLTLDGGQTETVSLSLNRTGLRLLSRRRRLRVSLTATQERTPAISHQTLTFTAR